MSENPAHEPYQDTAPEPILEQRSRISVVWLIPLVAALIGAFLVYKAISERGPTITIVFNSAEGLEAGKTTIRHKDVQLGQVEKVALSEDLSEVVVTAQMVDGAERYLTENTRFWVVRARVAAGEVSGLGTLFSGAYIGMDPVTDGEAARQFRALDTPPAVTTGESGRQFVLRTPRLGFLEIGEPVYYRQIKVGQIVGYELDQEGEAVEVQIFIRSPHDKQVRQNTRFWNASGVDVSIDANGIQVRAESLISLLIGGIAFETPSTLEPGGPAEPGAAFRLYESRDAIYERTYTRKSTYILYFRDSVRGLSPGAPVEFRGIRVGQVADIKVQFDTDALDFRIPVLIELELDRVDTTGTRAIADAVDRKEILDRLVEKGLRAQLKTGNLITGQLFIELDFHPKASPAAVEHGGDYPEIPTVPAPLDEITASLTQLLDKVGRFPIEEIGENLQETVEGTNQLVNSDELREAVSALQATLDQTQSMANRLNTDMMSSLDKTLEQARVTLEAAENVVDRDSALNQDLKRVLQELSSAARSIRLMADYLERHPDALIYGKGGRR